MKKIIFFVILFAIAFIFFNTQYQIQNKRVIIQKPEIKNVPAISSPLSISAMRKKVYAGSEIIIEQTLTQGINYNPYIVSYKSGGLKIFGLLTVPMGDRPSNGWPVIIFNHGYIPPDQYSTENSYAAMVDPLASSGYIVFKPDYRGNGNSEGEAVQIYVSPDYLTDSMNALASIKKYRDANPNKIGVFGHSMGGNITLHQLVITHDFQAAELMAGVVGGESGIVDWWNRRFGARIITGNDLDAYYIVEQMVQKNRTPSSNPAYWDAIDPTKFISDIQTPVEIQVGTSDSVVPPSFSSSLRDILERSGKTVVYNEFAGADHNLAPDLSSAMQKAILFFKKYLR